MACEFVKLANGQLVAVPLDGKKVRNSPVEFGCHLSIKDRSGRGLTKQRLRSLWGRLVEERDDKTIWGYFYNH